jgi:glycosyltransferase involved in cell wall biosynthesis
MKEPLVTICIPNYNGRKYLKQCIDSALNQDYNNIEIIISDNKSNDDSYKVLEEYKNKKKVKIIFQEKFLPMTTHWNIFKKFINGELVIWLSADDMIFKECISNVIKMYNKDINLKAVFFEYEIIDKINNTTNKTPFFNQSALINSKQYFEIFLKGNNFPLSTCVMTKNIFKEIGGFNEKLNFCSDWFMWLSIAEKNGQCRIGYLRNKLAFYRIHSSNETNRNVINKNAISEIENMKSYFIRNNYTEEKRDKIKEQADFGTAKIALAYAKLMREKNLKNLEEFYMDKALQLNSQIINERLFKELKGTQLLKTCKDSFIKNSYELPDDSIAINI